MGEVKQYVISIYNIHSCFEYAIIIKYRPRNTTVAVENKMTRFMDHNV